MTLLALAIAAVSVACAIFAHMLFAPPRPKAITQAEVEETAATSKAWMTDGVEP